MKKSLIKQIIIILVTALISSTLTLGYVYKENFQAMYLQKIIEDDYYGEVNKEKLADGAMMGLIFALGDENSYFVDGETGYDAYIEELNGEFTGVGIKIAETEEGCFVTSVVKGSPAEEKGLMAGDIIIGVDGEDVTGLGITGISNKVRGEAGTEVSITVKRNEETLTLKLMRAKIIETTIDTKKYDDVAYIKINDFTPNTDGEFKDALEEMKDCSGAVIDLRNNGGGLLEASINMLDMIIKEGNFITTKERRSEFTYEASGKQIFTKPIVVLVNEYSASASEFFAAAVKENDRGTIVGVTTYGKGSIQRSYHLPGNKGVHLTIGRFYSPKGNEIEKVGVTPDVEVQNSEKYELYDVSAIPFEEDFQLKKALEIIKNKK